MHHHISKQFDLELSSIRSLILEMGSLVVHQIEHALLGFEDNKTDTLEQVIQNDVRVNTLQMSIDDNCSQIIALRQPTARDLRVILSAIQMTTDLERAGDEAKNIARISHKLIKQHYKKASVIDLEYLGSLAVKMLKDAIHSFEALDTNAVTTIARMDEKLDHAFRAIIRQMITFMMEDPRTISENIDLLFIAKALERIGDHAKNTSEYIIYIVEGRDIRHTRLIE